MRQIKLTQDQFALVDEIDYDRLLAVNSRWQAVKYGNTFYAKTYLAGKMLYMHRLILDAELVDHIDRNGLNNCRDNLRASTKRLNTFNSKVNTRNSCGVTGVYRASDGVKRWRAHIGIAGVSKSLGRFYTFEEAVAARWKAEQELFNG